MSDIRTGLRLSLYGCSVLLSMYSSALELQETSAKLTALTAIEQLPSSSHTELLLGQKGGALWLWHEVEGLQLIAELPVLSHSELGLLGLALHPQFPQKPWLFISDTVSKKGKMVSRLSRYDLSSDDGKWSLSNPLQILTQEQPYANHNGGHIDFGPDGYLYMAFGDGGGQFDPMQNGQNTSNWLGTVLRINVNGSSKLQPYRIPTDNPLKGVMFAAEEIYAWGFRNPWKFDFDEQGRLWLADVGQNQWEEVNLVEKGGNYGWHCQEAKLTLFEEPQCQQQRFIDPIFAYDHQMGRSITGGIASGGYYLIADFVSGRYWQINEEGLVADSGQWSIQPSSFFQTSTGERFVADFSQGLYKIMEPETN